MLLREFVPTFFQKPLYPWSFVNNTAGPSGAGGIGGSTTNNIDTTNANLIVVAVNYYGTLSSPRPPTLTDSASNTWVQLTDWGGTSQDSVILYYCITPTTSATHNFTVAASNSYATAYVQAWKSNWGTPVFDQESGATGSTISSIQPGSITASVDNCLFVTGFNGSGGTVTGISSPFTISDQMAFVSSVQFAGQQAYYVQSTAVAINPTCSTNGTYIDLVAVMANFKPN